MRRRMDPGLYGRLLASYLLVILVGCVTLYWAGGAFADYFFDRYMGGMMQQMRHTNPMMEAMAADLNDAYRRANERSMMWGVATSAVVAMLVGFFVTRRIVTPLRGMRRASRRIAHGRYEERLPVSAPGEIGELAASFNEMAGALERIEARRVDLLANVAHEFRTPLTNLRGYVSGLRDGMFQPDPETLDACARQLARLERLVADLTLLSRVESGEEPLRPQVVDAGTLLEHAAAAFRPRFEARGVDLRVEAPPSPAPVLADPQRTAQVIENLLANALAHTAHGDRVDLRAEPAAGDVLFHVQDSGVGIPPEDLPHLFTRFYRVDKSRGYDPAAGSGIGLTIVKHYVERQGGRVGVDSRPGEGSRFWFAVPAATPQRRGRGPAEAPARASSHAPAHVDGRPGRGNDSG